MNWKKRKDSLNSKVMNALFCALDNKELHRVSSCKSAHEIWNKLKVVYERAQIKRKNLKLVDTLDNMNCFKWNKMRVCILCILDL